MRISAKADYAVRAAVHLATAQDGRPIKGDAIATSQAIPLKFLENILADLRHAGLVRSQRGSEGGYWLIGDPASISVADVIRAVEGPMASIRGQRPEDVPYDGSAEALQQVWIAVRANLRAVLEATSLADVATGTLPENVRELAAAPDAWASGAARAATAPPPPAAPPAPS